MAFQGNLSDDLNTKDDKADDNLDDKRDEEESDEELPCNAGMGWMYRSFKF